MISALDCSRLGKLKKDSWFSPFVLSVSHWYWVWLQSSALLEASPVFPLFACVLQHCASAGLHWWTSYCEKCELLFSQQSGTSKVKLSKYTKIYQNNKSSYLIGSPSKCTRLQRLQNKIIKIALSIVCTGNILLASGS